MILQTSLLLVAHMQGPCKAQFSLRIIAARHRRDDADPCVRVEYRAKIAPLSTNRPIAKAIEFNPVRCAVHHASLSPPGDCWSKSSTNASCTCDGRVSHAGKSSCDFMVVVTA